jgi:hypothetical protein
MRTDCGADFSFGVIAIPQLQKRQFARAIGMPPFNQRRSLKVEP